MADRGPLPFVPVCGAIATIIGNYTVSGKPVGVSNAHRHQTYRRLGPGPTRNEYGFDVADRLRDWMEQMWVVHARALDGLARLFIHASVDCHLPAFTLSGSG